MSTFPAYFRHRTYGPRCSSPPTFVCYELPQPEPYSRSATPTSDEYSDDEDDRDDESSTDSNSNSEAGSQGTKTDPVTETTTENKKVEDDMSAEVAAIAVDKVNLDDKNDAMPSETATAEGSVTEQAEDSEEERKRIEKREGKKKEVPVPEETTEATTTPVQVEKKRKEKKKSKRRTREESPAPPVRPILTIRSSHGFVWNQDLFVPPYIKERYIASSPPSSISSIHGTPPKSSFRNNNFFSTSNEMDYEVECVEIRVSEGEMDHLIPRCR